MRHLPAWIDKNADIVDALRQRAKSNIDTWLRTFSASPGPVATLTTTECYRLYSLWCAELKETPIRAEIFAHEMKLLQFPKKIKTIRNSKRIVYGMNETAALQLLAAHRKDPTPTHYRLAFDVGYYRVMGLHFKGMEADSPLSPFPPEWYVGRKELLQVCYFGMMEAIDAISNSAFEIFFLKMAPV
jgi:hypothetical protein